MNLGQRIWKKYSAKKEIDEEIKEIEAIIDQISQNEKPIPEINLNLKLNIVYKELETYIKNVDEKLFEIRKKYFEPNGLYFSINICKTELNDYGYISVDSGGDTINQLEFDFVKNNSEKIEYSICDELFYKWEEYLLDNLLDTVNINKLAMFLGALWYVNDYGDKNFKVIETNRDT